MSLRDSFHFVGLDDLPEVDASDSIRDVFAALERGKAGGAVIHQGGRPTYYLKGLELGQLFLRELGKGSNLLGDSPGDAPVEWLVQRAIETAPVVPIDPDPVEESADAEPLTCRSATVFRVALSGSPVGWFLNHEYVRDTATRRARFVCDGPKKHETYDPDHGMCGRCPGRLSRVVSE